MLFKKKDLSKSVMICRHEAMESLVKMYTLKSYIYIVFIFDKQNLWNLTLYNTVQGMFLGLGNVVLAFIFEGKISSKTQNGKKNTGFIMGENCIISKEFSWGI